MDLRTVQEVLEAEACSRQINLETEVTQGCGADLMSDVLAYAHPGSILMTGLTHPQVVRTAEMSGITAIVFVRAKSPPRETIELAEEIGLPLLKTGYTMFDACGRLYAAGLPGVGLCTPYTPVGDPE